MEIINNKLSIQCDNTEEGIANDLVVAGVAKQDIVLGFHELSVDNILGLLLLDS